ncbi:MAG: ABC transporter ATP-binding protein, partial [Terriglobales bacterium]
QQIGSPQDLYERPVNLFVAGFVGSPSMNFFAGELSSDTVTTPLGAVRLSDATRQRLQGGKEQSRNVVVGIRPEAFEDAQLVGDTERGVTVTEHVDILESIGSAKFAYLNLESHAAPRKLTEIATETGNEGAFGSSQLVAQLDPRSTTQEGEDLKLWFDPADMLLFDADSGKNLTV